MLTYLAISLSWLALTVQAGETRSVKPPLTVTYVGNTGFLVQCDGRKVAIDAMFGGWKSSVYDVPSDSIVNLMKSAQPPFRYNRRNRPPLP